MTKNTKIDEAAELSLERYLDFQALIHVFDKISLMGSRRRLDSTGVAEASIRARLVLVGASAKTDMTSLALLGVNPQLRKRITEAAIELWARPNTTLYHFDGGLSDDPRFVADLSEEVQEKFSEIVGRPGIDHEGFTGFAEAVGTSNLRGSQHLLLLAACLVASASLEVVNDSLRYDQRIRLEPETHQALSLLKGALDTRQADALRHGVIAGQVRASTFESLQRLAAAYFDSLFPLNEGAPGYINARNVRSQILGKVTNLVHF